MSYQIERAVKHNCQPAALRKAESLFRYATNQGGGLATFEVVLTDAEADELLDWIPISGLVAAEGLPQLEEDIAEARRKKDPWFVLQHFSFYNLPTTPLRKLS